MSFARHANLRAQYGFNTEPAPFDPREADQRDTIIDPRAERLLMNVDDPVIRADVLAERTDHAPLLTIAVYEPQDKPVHPVVRMARDAGCWVFDLFSPDVANEKPMTAERRAAMEQDRELLKILLIYTAMVMCAGAFCWSVFQVLLNFMRWVYS